jgi:outer membrane immunogenic protein
VALAAPAMAEPIAFHRWASFYAGLNAGFGRPQESFEVVPAGALISIPFDGSLGWGQSLAGSSTAGFTGGGEIGYNWQPLDQLVFGLEADAQYFGGSVHNDGSFHSSVPPSAPGGFATLSNSVSSTTPWFGTLRGRIGTTIVNPNLLVFATGGLAYGQEKVDATITATAPGAILVSVWPFNQSQTGFGYTLGGGAEWAVDGRWSVKAEYLYISLPAIAQVSATTFLGPSAFPTDQMSLTSSRNVLNIVRFAVNYRL